MQQLLIQTVATVICAVVASSGFWAFMNKKNDFKDAQTEMLIGLGHDRIVYLGSSYLSRGDWITVDEYENLNDYLYKPYNKMGGNGSAERIMLEVRSKLRIVKNAPKKEASKCV